VRHPKLVVAVLVVALVAYFVLIGSKAITLFREGTVLGIGLGIGAVLLPVVGVVLVAFELRFGWHTEKLGRQLASEGGLPAPDVVRRPSGRVAKTEALPYFEQVRADVEVDRENWRVWFRLADAYDLAGDRHRARGAMRTAIALYRRAAGS
jgi:hypothetical protein